jgi:N-acetyl-anhydromuramyl-L-alanine amidase AmpD
MSVGNGGEIGRNLKRTKMQLPKIKLIPFPENQFYKEEHPKEILVFHHTASGRGSDGDYRHWLGNPERVATSQIIEENGECAQLFNSKYWGHHIGAVHPNNRRLNERSIGLEIDNWGGLTYDLKTKTFKSYTGAIIHTGDLTEDCRVEEYSKSFRGYRFFQKYTADQIEACRLLSLHYAEKYKIPLTYNEDMWDVSPRALNGTPGLWSHTSYRKDKSDIHPQKEMVAMLKNLSK